MSFLFFLLKNPKVVPGVTILSLMKVAPSVIFHRSFFFFFFLGMTTKPDRVRSKISNRRPTDLQFKDIAIQ